jgi:hypothetical protein
MTAYELDDALVRKFLDGATFSGDELEIALRSQLPKPPVEEPADFGSVVRASWGDNDRCLWIRRNGVNCWEDAAGLNASWSYLSDVEVLRVGVDGVRPLTAADLSRMSIAANAANNGEAKADPYNDQEWSNAACPEHGTHCSGGDCCCADKHPTAVDDCGDCGDEPCGACWPVVEAFTPDPVEALILLYSKHLYGTAATMSEEMVEFNLRTFLIRVREAGKAA